MSDVVKDFIDDLESLLDEAQDQKNVEPKSDMTRYWAVIYTDLEKIFAYAVAYLAGSEDSQ